MSRRAGRDELGHHASGGMPFSAVRPVSPTQVRRMQRHHAFVLTLAVAAAMIAGSTLFPWAIATVADRDVLLQPFDTGIIGGWALVTAGLVLLATLGCGPVATANRRWWALPALGGSLLTIVFATAVLSLASAADTLAGHLAPSAVANVRTTNSVFCLLLGGVLGAVGASIVMLRTPGEAGTVSATVPAAMVDGGAEASDGRRSWWQATLRLPGTLLHTTRTHYRRELHSERPDETAEPTPTLTIDDLSLD